MGCEAFLVFGMQMLSLRNLELELDSASLTKNLDLHQCRPTVYSYHFMVTCGHLVRESSYGLVRPSPRFAFPFPHNK
jgi:hypothetical protein